MRSVTSDRMGRVEPLFKSDLPPARADGKPRLLRLPRQQMTTAQCCSLYPFQAEAGLGERGVLVGTTWPAGALFYYDPFALYADGQLDNPNVMVFGEPGSGKSAAVKCLLARHVGLLGRGGVGRQAFIVDPKQIGRA